MDRFIPDQKASLDLIIKKEREERYSQIHRQQQRLPLPPKEWETKPSPQEKSSERGVYVFKM